MDIRLGELLDTARLLQDQACGTAGCPHIRARCVGCMHRADSASGARQSPGARGQRSAAAFAEALPCRTTPPQLEAIRTKHDMEQLSVAWDGLAGASAAGTPTAGRHSHVQSARESVHGHHHGAAHTLQAGHAHTVASKQGAAPHRTTSRTSTESVPHNRVRVQR